MCSSRARTRGRRRRRDAADPDRRRDRRHAPRLSGDRHLARTRRARTSWGSACGSSPSSTGATHTSWRAAKSRPLVARARGEDRLELGAGSASAVLELPLGELGPADRGAERGEELRLERAERDEPAVLRPVHGVAGGAAVEELAPARERRPARPGHPERQREHRERALRHRDVHVRALAGPPAPEQRREDPGHRRPRAARHVRDLHAERRRRGPASRSRASTPAKRAVVEVVAGALRVRPVLAVAADRAEDERAGSRAGAPPSRPRAGRARPAGTTRRPRRRRARAGGTPPRPPALRRSSAIDRLFRLSAWKAPDSPRRRAAASRAASRRRRGSSTFTTSAPRSARTIVANGPGRSRVRSRTRTPASGSIAHV